MVRERQWHAEYVWCSGQGPKLVWFMLVSCFESKLWPLLWLLLLPVVLMGCLPAQVLHVLPMFSLVSCLFVMQVLLLL